MSWIKVNNFLHASGDHCESTTLRNVLRFLGFPYSEAMIFGLDATLGFSFWGINPKLIDISSNLENWFIGGKQGWFQNQSLACRLLGVQIETRTFQTANAAWEDAKVILIKGFPMILQVDMGFLPFFTDLGEFHFGGHLVSLFGYNDQTLEVLIGDNNYEKPQIVPLKALQQARASNFGPKFLHPHNVRYVLTHRSDGKRPPFGAAAKLAIQEVVKNMLSPSTNNLGLPGLQNFMAILPEILKNPQQNKVGIISIYKNIEEYGTGGSCFRKLYHSFCKELLQSDELQSGPRGWNTKDREILEQVLSYLHQDVEIWHDLALLLKNSSENNINSKSIDQSIEKVKDYGNQIELLEKQIFTQLKQLKI
jgi:hypothetical protein